MTSQKNNDKVTATIGERWSSHIENTNTSKTTSSKPKKSVPLQEKKATILSLQFSYDDKYLLIANSMNGIRILDIFKGA